MTSKRMVRCTEGHPYDASAQEVCPVCGAAPIRQTMPSPDPIPPKPLPTKVLAGIAVVTVALVSGFFIFWKSPQPILPPAKPEIAQKDDKAANNPVQKQAPAPSAANSLASNLKNPPPGTVPQSAPQERSTPSDTPRVTQFMTVDPNLANALRRAVAPAAHDDVEPKLLSLSPQGTIEDDLKFSVLLRRRLMNRRAEKAFAAGDVNTAGSIVSALAALPPIAPNFIDTISANNAGDLLAGKGGPADRLANAGRLLWTAADHGYFAAAVTLATRPDIVGAAHIDQPEVLRFLKVAAAQSPLATQQVAGQLNLNIDAQKALLAKFNDASANRNWDVAVSAYLDVGAPQIPWFEALLSQRLMQDSKHLMYAERALVASVIGALADYRGAEITLSYFNQSGEGGVARDAPNTVGWIISALANIKNDQPSAELRNRLKQNLMRLTDNQRHEIFQLADELHVALGDQ